MAKARGSAPHAATNVLHEEDEVKVVGGALLELRDEVEVELASLGRLCVNDQAIAANISRELEESSEHILELPIQKALS